MTAVTLSNLTKLYQKQQAVISNLNLSVESGELLALLGPSGAGKTTILRLIAGLLLPDEGDVLFDGRSVRDLPPEKRGAVMVFQEHQLFPFMSVGDNVAFGLKLRGRPWPAIRRRVAEALAAVQLAGFESRRPDQLSGGQRQRVALARALAVRPRLLLLDEPLSNLDRELREELREVICTLQREAGITTLFVTHDQAEAVAVADRVALLLNGRIRQVGPPRQFYEQPADAQVADFFGSVNLLPGTKTGRFVQTALGPLEILSTDIPDGEVLLSIRPEAIEIGSNGYNNLPAQVLAYAYHGSLAHCTAASRDIKLQIAASPFTKLQMGQQITLHLPRERIHLLSG